MINYIESKKKLDKIRSEYGCKGEIIFRTALQYIVDCGQQSFQDEDWVNEQLELREGKEFQKVIIECAVALAEIDAYDLIIYIQKEVWLSNEGGIAYERAVRLLKGCMSNIEMWNDDQCDLTLGEFEDIGFDDDEIEMLGFGYVLDVKEDDE